MADYLHPDSIENKLGLGRVPEEPQEGIVWRGMSGGEFKNLLRQGFLESKGEYNIGDTGIFCLCSGYKKAFWRYPAVTQKGH